MEEEEKSISLGEIFRIIGKKIWLILGVSALVAIIAVLVVQFALNPAQAAYKMDFRILYPTSSSEKYPDGTPFYYDDIISKESLEQAKATNEKFASIDVDGIIRGDKITISAETETVNGVKRFTGRYTVTLLDGAVKDRATAEAFITALANLPVETIKGKAQNINFSIDENTYQNASFKEKITLLREMKSILLRQYDQWISLYRESYPVQVEDASMTLENLRAKVSVTFGDTMQANFQKELERNGFDQIDLERAGGDLEKAVEYARTMLEREYELNENIIDALKDALQSSSGVGGLTPFDDADGETSSGRGDTIIVGNSGLSELLATYTERNAKIAYQIGAIGANGTLTLKNAQDYKEDLDFQYGQLKELAGTLTKVTASIYETGTRVLFDSQKANISGKTSIIIAAVAGFVIAFLVCAVAVYASDRRKSKRTPLAQGGQEPAPAEKAEEHKENE